jgi:hypothetical protein
MPSLILLVNRLSSTIANRKRPTCWLLNSICERLLVGHKMLQLEKRRQSNPSVVSTYELYLPLRGHCFVNDVFDVFIV